jgi:hypothetical protein
VIKHFFIQATATENSLDHLPSFNLFINPCNYFVECQHPAFNTIFKELSNPITKDIKLHNYFKLEQMPDWIYYYLRHWLVVFILDCLGVVIFA